MTLNFLIVKFCEHILGVHRRSVNKTVMSELGVYSLHIDAKLNIISFYLYLKNTLLSKSLKEMEILNSEWFKCANKLIPDPHPNPRGGGQLPNLKSAILR